MMAKKKIDFEDKESEILQDRDAASAELSRLYDREEKLISRIKNAEVLTIIGDTSQADLDSMKREFDEVRDQIRLLTKRATLLQDALKEVRQRKADQQREQRKAQREKLLAATGDYEQIIERYIDAALELLLAVEIKFETRVSAGNVAKLLQSPLMSEGSSLFNGMNTSIFLQRLNQKRQEKLEEVA